MPAPRLIYQDVRWLLFFFSVMAVQWLPAQELSNRGTHFWYGYGHNYNFTSASSSDSTVLYFSADRAATVTVKVNATAYRKTYTIPANSVVVSDIIPREGSEDARLITEGHFRRGIEITSDVPIVAYAHSYSQYNSGATLLLPDHTYGNDYVALTAIQEYDKNYAFSWMFMIATEDNTVIEITPSVPTLGGREAGVPFRVVLNKGEIYNVMGGISLVTRENYDLTGSTVKQIIPPGASCAPFAFFCGNSRTEFCYSGTGYAGGDYIVQQAFPKRAWGTQYFTSPHVDDNNKIIPAIVRVLVGDTNTIVTVNGTRLTKLKSGFYEFETNKVDYIESDQPIMVAQYMQSYDCTNYGRETYNIRNWNQDPEMFYLSSLEQGIKKIIFFNPSKYLIEQQLINITIPRKGLASLKIDGVSNFPVILTNTSKPEYVTVIHRLTKGQHIASADIPFTAITYGLGFYESYGYNAGTLLKNLENFTDIRNLLSSNARDNNTTCEKTSFRLRFFSVKQPSKITWTSGATTFNYNNITLDNPQVADSVLVGLRKYYVYEAPEILNSSKSGNYKADVTFYFPAMADCGINDVTTHEILVQPALTSNIATAFSGCQYDTLFPKVLTPAGDSIAKITWQLGSQAVYKIKEPAIKVTDSSDILIRMDLVSNIGCESSAAAVIPVYPAPVAKIISDSITCVNATLKFLDASFSRTQVTERIWKFDNVHSGNNSKNATYQFATAGIGTVMLIVKSALLCESLPVTKTIRIDPLPAVAFTMPESICFPGEKLLFTNMSSIPYGTIDSLRFKWDFGDGVTDTTVSPAHLYTASKNYPISLKATSTQNCSAVFTRQFSRFLDKPVVSAQVQPPYCLNVPVTFTDKSDAVQGSISGYEWFINKKPVSQRSSFEHTFTTIGQYLIQYRVKNTANCYSDTLLKVAEVFSLPIVKTIPFIEIELQKDTILQNYASGKNLSFAWSPASYLSSSIVQLPVTRPLNDINYTLTITDMYGCTASANTKVSVLKPILNIPNAFSPNNDGVNDYWIIPDIHNYRNADLKIFDRYGRNIYQKHGTLLPWDGRYNGNPLPVGTYYYTLLPRPGSRVLSGSITLLR